MAAEGTNVDEAFLQALYRGSDLLGGGDAAAAREALQEALDLRPQDPKARNLYGLACFKLGELEEALYHYQALVHASPHDVTLRVNLGLVHLKQGRYEEAIKELQAAVDLEPAHRRANNYLGLASARVGDYALARDCFDVAGSEHMVERMDRALAGEEIDLDEAGSGRPQTPPPTSAAPQAPLAVAPPPPTPPPATPHSPEAASELPPAPVAPAAAEAPPPPAAAPASPQEGPTPSEATPAPEPPMPAPDPGPRAVTMREEEAFGRWTSGTGLLAAAEALTVRGVAGSTFSVNDELVVISLEGVAAYTTLEGLVAIQGQISLDPAKKRFRGKDTDSPFGADARRMHRAAGQGRVLLARARAWYEILHLDGVDAYFCERSTVAFEDSLAYENGRVPCQTFEDLALVHLRGSGGVVVGAPGRVLSAAVRADRPLKVPLGSLVGWHGALTPRVEAVSDEVDAPVVSLVGEGVALISLPAGLSGGAESG